MPQPKQPSGKHGNRKPAVVKDLNYDRRNYDEFRETLATSIPNSRYRSLFEASDEPSLLEKLIRYVAVILSAIVAARLIFGLFTTGRGNPVINLTYSLTDWIVQPFQAVFGGPPTGPGGYFDWPAVAAILAIALVAALCINLVRPRSEDHD